MPNNTDDASIAKPDIFSTIREEIPSPKIEDKRTDIMKNIETLRFL